MDVVKCLKKCFRSKGDAKKFMKEQNRRWDFGYTDAYFCEQCQSYHLTTMPKQRARDYKRFLNNQ